MPSMRQRGKSARGGVDSGPGAFNDGTVALDFVIALAAASLAAAPADDRQALSAR